MTLRLYADTTEFLSRIFLPNIFENVTKKNYLKGLTVVNRNLSAKPLSAQIVFPIEVRERKNGWG